MELGKKKAKKTRGRGAHLYFDGRKLSLRPSSLFPGNRMLFFDHARIGSLNRELVATRGPFAHALFVWNFGLFTFAKIENCENSEARQVLLTIVILPHGKKVLVTIWRNAFNWKLCKQLVILHPENRWKTYASRIIQLSAQERSLTHQPFLKVSKFSI